ncbi:hypothetical protein D3C84_1137080 [compost metagenome]
MKPTLEVMKYVPELDGVKVELTGLYSPFKSNSSTGKNTLNSPNVGTATFTGLLSKARKADALTTLAFSVSTVTTGLPILVRSWVRFKS